MKQRDLPFKREGRAAALPFQHCYACGKEMKEGDAFEAVVMEGGEVMVCVRVCGVCRHNMQLNGPMVVERDDRKVMIGLDW